MKRFKTRTIFIQAEQFRPENKPWPEGVKVRDTDFWGSPHENFYYLDTPLDSMAIDPGDWIVKHGNGDLGFREPGIFQRTYEPVDDVD